MIAMELNGSHVGKKVKLTWTGVRGKKFIESRMISQITHRRNGDVQLGQSTYHSESRRFPPYAEVEFIND